MVIANRMKEFSRNTKGNVAMLFGVSLMPLMMCMGAAVDYSRAASARTSLQAAVDSAAFAAARQSPSLTDSELQKYAASYFQHNFHPSDKVTITQLTISRNADTVVVSAKGNLDTTLLKAVKFGDRPILNMDIGTRAEVAWGATNMEVALVLDSTGSMKGAKLAAMQKAAKELVSKLEDASNSAGGKVRIAVVPFNSQVRLDTSYSNKPWLYFPEGSARNWQGCVADRSKPYDVTLAPASSNAATGYWAPTNCQYGDLARMQPLNTSFSTVRNAIDSMTAVGNTNVTIGAVWGHAMLSSTSHIGTAAPAAKNMKKIMVILTDGDNTESRHARGRDIDPSTEAVCTNIKTDGVQVYTIRVMDGNANLLRNCASDPSMYYNVENVSELLPAFNDIARDLIALRLSM
jgi:Flp pilus assembly protein TadG